MEDTEIRLECLRLASGDQKTAAQFYAWVSNQPKPDPNTLLTAAVIEGELLRLTGSNWSVTGGKDGLYRVTNEIRAEAVRFTDSDLAMSLEDFSAKLLKPLVDKFNN